MKSVLLLLLTVALLSACGSKQEGAEGTQTAQSEMTSEGNQTGTATGSVSGEVIGSDMGYIVENAKIVKDPAGAVYSIKGVFLLGKGNSNVLIVKTGSGATEWLALQFPSFAEGTTMEYSAGDANSGFWIFGVKGKKEITNFTGAVVGTLRLLKKAPSTVNLGLNRDMMDGVGEMEIVVTGIQPDGLDIPAEKKYAARFTLPFISLAELAKMDQPI